MVLKLRASMRETPIMQATLPMESWQRPDNPAYLPPIPAPAGYPAARQIPRWLRSTRLQSKRYRADPMSETGAPGPKAPRPRYFQDARLQKRYYGIKRNIGYRTKYPLSQFWDAPIMRGSDQSLALVGPSYKQASDEQKRNRKSWMMSGRGKYMQGRGGFFGGLAGLLTGQGWKAGSDMGDKVWDAVKTPATSIATSMGIPLQQIMSASDAAGKAGQHIADYVGKGMYGKRRLSGQGLYRGKGLYKGRGEYATNHIITDGGATASAIVPRFNTSDVTSITMSNREYVRDIFAPPQGVAFATQSWSLNPGLAESFPWLSQLAINFEEYEIVQLIYTFKSVVADFASQSGQVGQIVMATQYNPDSDPFADKEEMMLYDGGQSCKTTESLLHGIECDPVKNSGAAGKYVRVGSLPTGEDLKNYDHGKTTLAVINCPTTYAGQQLGELWVSYTVRLRKPKFAAGNAYNIRRDVFAIKYVNLSGNFLPVGTDILYAARNSLGCQMIPGTAAIPQGGTTDDLLAQVPTTFSGSWNELFRIVIPDSYSGVLSVTVRQSHPSTGDTTLKMVASNSATIFRFKDIPLGFTYASDGTVANSLLSNSHYKIEKQEFAAGANNNRDELVLHVRVLPVTNGIKNVLYFAWNNSNIGVQLSVEVSQYNTFLSVSDNGSDDQIGLNSSITKQRITWT